MSRKASVILFLLALALTGASIWLSRQDSTEWRANRARKLFTCAWKDVVSVIITPKDGETVELERQGNRWMVRLDGDLFDLASMQALAEVEAMVALAWRDKSALSRPPGDDATQIAVTDQWGTKFVLRLDKAVDGMRNAVMSSEGENTLVVPESMVRFAEWPRSRFRSLDLFQLDGTALSGVVLRPDATSEADVVELRKEPDGWRVVKPFLWEADPARLDRLERLLRDLRASDVAAEKVDDSAWFEIGDDSESIMVQAESGSGVVQQTVQFGKPDGNGAVFAKVDGRNPVFLIPLSVLSDLPLLQAGKHKAEWRDFYRRRGVDLLGADLPGVITVESLLPHPRKLTIDLGKATSSGAFTALLESDSGKREFMVDSPNSEHANSPLRMLLTGLKNLRIRSFLADRSPGESTLQWTAFPAWRIAVDGPGGKREITLYSSDAEGRLACGQPYVVGLVEPQSLVVSEDTKMTPGLPFSISGKDAVLETYGELSSLFCLPLERYQSRLRMDADYHTWTKVEVITPEWRRVFIPGPRSGNEQWWRVEKDQSYPLLEDNHQFVTLAIGLSRLYSLGVVADVDANLAEFGLDRPAISVIVTGHRDKEYEVVARVDVGSRVDGGEDAVNGYYAKLGDGGPIFLLPDDLVTSLLRDYR